MIGAGAVVALLVLVIAVVYAVDAAQKDEIPENVRVATLDVGGMERDKAAVQIRRGLAGTTNEPVAVMFRETHFVLRPEVAKARIDIDTTGDAAVDAAAGKTVAPRVAFARGAVQAFAGRIAERVDREPREADIDWHDGRLDRTPARAPASRSTRWRWSRGLRASWPTPRRNAGSRWR